LKEVTLACFLQALNYNRIVMNVLTTPRIAALLFAGFSIYCLAACRTSYPVTTDRFTADKQQADLVHGRMLVMSSCGGCHYNRETGRLTGNRMKDLPKLLGKSYAANLTASEQSSPVPHYSDAELAYLLRTGIKRDGRFVHYMLRPNMADTDLRDLIAFLRWGKYEAAASDVVAGHTRLNFMGKLGARFIAKPQPYQTNISRPEATIETGRYLVDNIGCFHCHSKKKTSLNYLHPEKTKGYMAGGARFKTPGGAVRGSNITLDNETGIGFYTKSDFRKAVLHMEAPHNRKLRPPMEAFQLSEKEVDAIYEYLNTLPRISHKIKGQVQVAVR